MEPGQPDNTDVSEAKAAGAKRRLAGVLALVAVSAALLAGGYFAYRQVYVGRFYEIDPGKLYRCQQPRGLQWSVLGRYHVKTVVNLRTARENLEDFAEEQKQCDKAGAAMVNIPVAAAPLSRGQFEQFLAVVRSSPGAVLVHCELGRTRTGMAVAAYRIVVQGRCAADAWAEMIEHKASLRGVDETKLRELFADMEENRAQWLARTAAPAGDHVTSQPATGPSSPVPHTVLDSCHPQAQRSEAGGCFPVRTPARTREGGANPNIGNRPAAS